MGERGKGEVGLQVWRQQMKQRGVWMGFVEKDRVRTCVSLVGLGPSMSMGVRMDSRLGPYTMVIKTCFRDEYSFVSF